MAKKFKSNNPETTRMFKNNFLEFFSKVHPSVPVVIYVPVISILLYCSVVKGELTFLSTLFYIFFGMFVWTITEYLLHRFVFHFEPNSEIGKRLHFIFHGVHHDYPNDPLRLVMPPAVSIPLALMFYFVFLYFLGSSNNYPFFAGFLIGYLFYDMTHYAVHHSKIRNSFFLKLKKHHLKHHYQNPDMGYGVSSVMWDKLIGTDFSEKETGKQLVDESN
ncbi:MAG TPA: sterol desaturase family protein [Ignavibacteriaceae bacterium]|nr:sterol desaturase family protein [Ignavibacteriaceae bacterium]